MKACETLMPRSRRHPVADLPCGKPAKFFAAAPCHRYGEPMCGVHAAYWKRRGLVLVPIIEIKP